MVEPSQGIQQYADEDELKMHMASDIYNEI